MMGIVGVAGGSAVSMTLMACYGPPCVDAKCAEPPPDDAGHTVADAHVGDFDAGRDGGAELDAGADASRDASLDGPSDAPHDAPDAD